MDLVGPRESGQAAGHDLRARLRERDLHLPDHAQAPRRARARGRRGEQPRRCRASRARSSRERPRAIVDAEQDVLELCSGERVDRRERLVEQEQLGPRCEDARDRDALLHPTGKLPSAALDPGRPSSASNDSARATRSGRDSPRPRSGA